MKKHVLFYLLFVLIAMNARAQQHTPVTIGTGTTTSATNGPIIVDFATPTNYTSRHIGIYTAAELNATPLTSKAITKIAWYKADTARYKTTGGSIKIYLKHTATTNFTGSGPSWTTEVTGATEVYNVAMPSISSGAGWKEFALPTPFIWNGTSNLEVLVDWTGTGNIINTLLWQYSTVSSARSATTNNIGLLNISQSTNLPNIKFTFTNFNNDGGVSAINAPTGTTAPNVSTPVTATLKNFGPNAITSAVIGWKVNGVAQPDYTWSGNLATGLTDGPVTLGNFTFPNGGHTVKAYTKSINGVSDPMKINDTTTVQIVACSALSGNYTINKNAPASNTNFQSFNSAAQVLNSCGVSGPVTITVTPGSGPYNESVVLTNILNTSATNTITFEGSGNTITSANEVVFKLNNADYVKLNNLVITNTNNSGIKCAGLQLIGNSDFFTLSNCTINMPKIFGQNIIGIAIADGSATNFNTGGNFSNNSIFENNIFDGGFYSIRMNGVAVSGSAPTGAVNNRFVGNQFRDFYNVGIYFSNADGTKIENNIFTRPTLVDMSGFLGIQLASGSINSIISKNRFHNTHGAASASSIINGATGIQVEAAANAGQENIIKNNLFYNFNNQGNINVFNITNTATGVYIYNNTASLENPNRPASNNSNMRAFNAGLGIAAGGNVKFINNIISINMPGTGNKYAIYHGATPPATYVSNNNVLYLAPGQTNAYTAAIGTTTNYATLVNWQAVNTTAPYDMNSVAVNPGFKNLATGDLKPTAVGVNNIGAPLAAVTDDFMGVTRNTTTPDPGAYEFDVTDAGVSAITAPNSGCNLTNQETITITVNNFGASAISNIPVSYTINGGTPVTAVIAGPIAAGATVTYSFTTKANLSAPGSYTIEANTNLTGDVLATNDAFTKVVVSSAIPAVPTITAGGATTFCTGGSVTLTAASTTTGATFQWFNNGTAISGATNATYTANTAGSYTAVAAANGCSSAASAATTVTVNAIAAIPTITAGGPITFCSGGSVVLTAASTTTGATYTWFNNGTLITGANAATYTATTAGSYTAVATANGCPSAASAATVVTVNAAPSVPTITANGATTFCSGGSVTLTAASTTTGATYTWLLNGTAITGATNATYTANASGSYTVVATANGCDATSTATTVTVTPLPATPTITRNGFTLTSSSATGNQWYKDSNIIAGATNATYNTTANGTYTVVVTDNGCASASSNAVTITNTGVKEDELVSKVSVYPNPSNGLFNIKLHNAKASKLMVMDLSGKLIKEQTASAELNVLDMTGTAKGVYLLKVISSEGSAIKKLIVE